ncbi:MULTISPECIES: MobV family relaxase [Vibrio]|uniref:MobV family relaxase n=1 Tax=Vibrio TaxID=662 RepID=UPI0015E7C0A0|nr:MULTISPECIES: MobV family relaxase [Vibrio]
MGTTILRFEKIKNMANIRLAGAHQFRHHINTPNADPVKKSRNHTFLGSGNLGKDVQSRLERLTKPPRKNAVLAMDALVTLSPELLKDNKNLNIWANRTRDWLKARFGDNLVSAVVHLDELSPHLHFTVVPIDEKTDGRIVLNARDLFNKWQLADMQRSYNETMRQYIPDIIPPRHGRKASHTTIKAFYAELEEIRENLRQHSQVIATDVKGNSVDATKLHFISLIERCVQEVEGKLGCQLEEATRAKLIYDYQLIVEKEVSNLLNSEAVFELLDKDIQATIQSVLNKIKPASSA